MENFQFNYCRKIEEVFLFDEDKELHTELVKFDEIYRVPLILKLFHGFTVEQISVIFHTLNSDVIERIQTAKNMIGEPFENTSRKAAGTTRKIIRPCAYNISGEIRDSENDSA